ncbi:MAG: hypothetical protein J3K34DRAFT_419159 [Monoraphidium minutum]|nr:MAG: hypothetical protein J3K34DRAFT_419159 [Monoraphidium minutum]
MGSGDARGAREAALNAAARLLTYAWALALALASAPPPQSAMSRPASMQKRGDSACFAGLARLRRGTRRSKRDWVEGRAALGADLAGGSWMCRGSSITAIELLWA